MSSTNDAIICAACGKSSGSLKMCTACKSVRYCNAECQLSHRKAHKKACKCRKKELKAEAGVSSPSSSSEASTFEAAASADIERLKIIDTGDKDTDLFATPQPRDDCPICMLPLPLLIAESTYQPCCGKMLCGACILENGQVIREENSRRSRRRTEGDRGRSFLKNCCPFCRKPASKSNKEIIDRLRKRMGHDDAMAFNTIGGFYYYGLYGLPKDERKAFGYFLRAAELGSIEACSALAILHYKLGIVVEESLAKCKQYLELAAKGGHVASRRELGLLAAKEENKMLAKRQFLIAASAGDGKSLEYVSLGYRGGVLSKNEYAAGLRAYQKARDEMRSDERERYAAYLKRGGSRKGIHPAW